MCDVVYLYKFVSITIPNLSLKGSRDVHILRSRQCRGRNLHPLTQGGIAQTLTNLRQHNTVPFADRTVRDLTVPVRRIKGTDHYKLATALERGFRRSTVRIGIGKYVETEANSKKVSC